MKAMSWAWALAGPLLIPTATLAATITTITYTGSLPPAPTNSFRIISLPQFDPALGTLEQVMLDLTGTVSGSARYESLNSTPRTVTLNLSAQIAMKSPTNQPLSAVLPLVSLVSNADAYDGVLDFAGTSGRTYSHLYATATAPSIILTSPADLALFVGTDDLSFPIVGTGLSSGSGPGNIVYQFSTSTSAVAAIEYSYSEIIPEPACLAFLTLGALVMYPKWRRSSRD